MPDEPVTPPADPTPAADEPDPWDRLGKVIDERVQATLERFFPPDDPPGAPPKNEPRSGNDGGSTSGGGSSGDGGEPPKRGDSGGANPVKAQPSQNPVPAGAGERKRGFLDFLYK